MNIVKTKEYEPLQLREGQDKQISSAENIQMALQNDSCFGFYLNEKSEKIGFALLRQFEEKQFFLWDFLIDFRHQGLGKGKKFLQMIIDTLRNDYYAEVITTTYIFGNEVARKLYESVGFIQTEVICEKNVHEVNMELKCNK